MPDLIFQLSALEHNAEKTFEYRRRWGLEILPVLKMVQAHPAAIQAIGRWGGPSLAWSELSEGVGWGHPVERARRVLIGLAPPSRAAEIVLSFRRSFQSTPATLTALDEAAAGLGLDHDLFLFVDLGEGREGLAPADLPQILDLVSRFKKLRLRGLAASFGCVAGREPPDDFLGDLTALRDIYLGRMGREPEISLGGSMLLNWLRPDRTGLITELRLGDPFFIGEDIWGQAFPGGPFRRDVLTLAATVLERRGRQALVDVGRLHCGSGRLTCLQPGVRLGSSTAAYQILDLPPDLESIPVDHQILFRPDYWGAAAAIIHPAVNLIIRSET